MVRRLSRPFAGVAGGVLLLSALLPSSVAAAGVAKQLVFSVQPSNAVAGAVISPAVVVQVEDAYGQIVTSATGPVTISLGANASYGTLSGTTSVMAVNGIATFSNLSVNNPQTYTMVATDSVDGNLMGVSGPFTITGSGTGGGTGGSLAFVTQPGGGQPNLPWSQQPVVSVRDTNGNLITSPVTVTLSMGTNPGGGTLYCSSGTSVYTTTGYAYFTGCYITAAGSGYTLVASATGYTSVTSSPFTIGSAVQKANVDLDQQSAGTVTTSGPFGYSTKVVKKGQYITIKITTYPALAGADIGIWIAKKVNGVWTKFSPHTGRIANSQGVVYYYYKADSLVWLSFQAHFYGDATHAPSASRTVQARWIS